MSVANTPAEGAAANDNNSDKILKNSALFANCTCEISNT